MSIKIGITSQNKYSENGHMSMVQGAYVDAVIRAGFIPVIIPLTSDEALINKYIEMVDGVISCGGPDINSFYFNEQPIKQLGSISAERDEFEEKVINSAINNNKKLLGICRGCQFINALMGGTLYQDIYAQIENICGHNPNYEVIRRDLIYHYVDIKEGSLLHNLTGANRLGINSFHHQAIKDVANGFEVVAVSDDGLIEAIESEDKSILCIQWHPEEMTKVSDEALNIFRGFFGK
ncbi:gamma-glutamyl-gamma-aminobutyrate hydrolase family protein [Sedimentibacter sp. zth1]|uniref:gamma-glutamyl-gamma-aminobutyrate hydrolase family protein n=1 Tax=Sedimentibacter sp. zth1 TaxID=2816908 RepID=UPI001A91619C|nr:gamma-glutamyl-gamma-aminobutyrate hydrolase family protein [Sedimentibacter sp. zth1]QSX05608.1 gamma-glutamyl-gamma-aminobutyrate hydrolase family protein [Sedimentibacter sp. zth1]